MSESTYTGAPDECSIHWPVKLNKYGVCEIEGCPHSLTAEEAELAYQLRCKTIHDIFSGKFTATRST